MPALRIPRWRSVRLSTPCCVKSMWQRKHIACSFDSRWICCVQSFEILLKSGDCIWNECSKAVWSISSHLPIIQRTSPTCIRIVFWRYEWVCDRLYCVVVWKFQTRPLRRHLNLHKNQTNWFFARKGSSVQTGQEITDAGQNWTLLCDARYAVSERHHGLVLESRRWKKACFDWRKNGMFGRTSTKVECHSVA